MIKIFLGLLYIQSHFTTLLNDQIIADQGEDIPHQCSNEILQIYLEPSEEFTTEAKVPDLYQTSICPNQNLTCCSNAQLTNLKDQFLEETKKFQKVYDFNQWGWDYYLSFKEEDLQNLYQSQDFQTDRYKQCMGQHWDEVPNLMSKLKNFSQDLILSILKKVNTESAKYYSGFACELCNPRAVDGVDIDQETQTVLRVRHEWSSTYQKIYIVQQSLKILEFIYPIVMVSKSGYCQKYDSISSYDEIEYGYYNLDTIRRVIFMFCEDEKKFQPECLSIFQLTDPYDHDRSYYDIFNYIDQIVEGFNIIQKLLYPDREEKVFQNDWEGILEFYKKRPESKLNFQQGQYLEMKEYSMHIMRNAMGSKYWGFENTIKTLILIWSLYLQLILIRIFRIIYLKSQFKFFNQIVFYQIIQ